MICAAFSNSSGGAVVSTCEVSGWGNTNTEIKFNTKTSLLRQFYLTGEKVWIKTNEPWSDPQVTKISNKWIVAIGSSNGWDFGKVP